MRAQAEWKVITHIARVRAAEQQLDALAHLLAALFVKVIARISPGRAARCDEVGDAVREHARLARAGAGQDQQRPVAVGDRLALGLVEPLEQGVEVLRGGPGTMALDDSGQPGVALEPSAYSSVDEYAKVASTRNAR